MIEIYLLEALDAFEKYGTLSEAAEHLHISQPALSRSMKKLEETFDAVLFDRTRNRISLNETGKIAAGYARRILNEENEMVQNVRNFDNSLHMISVGYCAPGPQMEMPLFISRLYPRITVSSEMDEEDRLMKGLENHRFNMVILSHPVEDDQLVCTYYGSERLYISVIPAHPAAVYREKGIHFKDMDGETFLMAGDIGIWKELVKRTMPHSKYVIQNDLDDLNIVVNSSSLPAFATDLTVRLFRHRENRNRVFVPLKDPEAEMHYYCICSRETAVRFKELIDYLKKRN